MTQPAADADSSSDRTDTDTGNDVEEIIDALYGKRTSVTTREAALAALNNAMEGFMPAHDIEHAREDILSRCIISIRKGSTKEACLAIRAAALLAPDASAAKVIAALDCLAVVTFTGAEALDETEASLKVMWGLIHPQSGRKLAGTARKASAQELATAVSAWTFVLTRVTATTAGGRKVNPMEFLATLLYAEDRAVRIAAGEALAVCVELKLLPAKKGDLFRDMVARMSDLAIEAAGTGVDKKGFLEQKHLFKQLSAFMVHGERPERTVRTSSTQRGLLKVTTWSDVVRLKFLRRFLGPGFLHHLQGHGFMREVFDVRDEEIAGKLSAALWNPDLMKQDPLLARELMCESMEQKNRKEERKIWGGLEKRRTLSIKKDRRIANEVRYGGVGDMHGKT
ncbi:hypothetical protein QYE76_064738 [Lolium multiflorum]|uniref:Interferon-related developmental regulator N-terminal domain-containing protein n=1 Tax=Lolium multiflorum TaxID=4521 RepID=A0AAD8S8W8_LOLMU|nr:hypothetical protein QYE76_064738 [Lolium multiflorum]